MKPQVDQELVKETLQGKLSSFEILVKRYQERILAHAVRILGDKDEAEDAAQETFWRAFKALSSFRENSPFRPWLYQIATNYCYDVLRKKSKTTSLGEDMETEDKPILDRMIQIERVQKVKEALGSLPRMYAAPLIEYYWGELSYRSLAKSFDLPMNTIRTRLRRGRLLLARKLDGQV